MGRGRVRVRVRGRGRGRVRVRSVQLMGLHEKDEMRLWKTRNVTAGTLKREGRKNSQKHKKDETKKDEWEPTQWTCACLCDSPSPVSLSWSSPLSSFPFLARLTKRIPP